MIRTSTDSARTPAQLRRSAHDAQPQRPRWPWRVAVIVTVVALLAALGGMQWYGQRENVVLTDANAAAAADESPLLSLRRGGGYLDDSALRGDDRVVRSAVDGSGIETVFSAPRIQTFVADDRWAVVAVADRKTAATTLQVVDLQRTEGASSPTASLALPLDGTVIGLAVAGDTVVATVNPLDYNQPGGQVIAWSLSQATAAASPDAPSTQVAGVSVYTPDGALVQGNQAVLTDDGRFAVIRQWDDTMLRVSLAEARPDAAYDDQERAPLPLGSYTEVLGTAAQQRLLMSDASGAYALVDPVGGGRQRLDTSLPKGVESGSTLVQLSPASFGAVAVFESSGGDGTVDNVYALTPDGARRIATSQGRGTVSSVCASPSGKFVAVTTVPPDASDDGYVMMPNIMGVQTTVYAADQPVAVGDLPGGRPGWCQSYQRVAAGLY